MACGVLAWGRFDLLPLTVPGFSCGNQVKCNRAGRVDC